VLSGCNPATRREQLTERVSECTWYLSIIVLECFVPFRSNVYIRNGGGTKWRQVGPIFSQKGKERRRLANALANVLPCKCRELPLACVKATRDCQLCLHKSPSSKDQLTSCAFTESAFPQYLAKVRSHQQCKLRNDHRGANDSVPCGERTGRETGDNRSRRNQLDKDRAPREEQLVIFFSFERLLLSSSRRSQHLAPERASRAQWQL